ncbi:Hpt domain-containing protein [Paraglaciecola sp. 2405UD69-4]|uniref:Hpt domain-containing protein n=1 Tax=Paraglaciecola sp. 2405UD69-4 TaxID=3391836 RepID=UPI0039C91741
MDASKDIFNSEFALRQFSGSCPLLIKILDKFQLQYISFNETLNELIKQGDFETLQRDVHTLKGVSGNLGMEVLHQASKELEPKLSADVQETDITEYLEIVTTTILAITDFIKNNSDQPEQVADSGSKQLLVAALKRNEFISESKMQKFMQDLDLADDVKNAIKNAINDFDYILALQLLQ